MQLPRPSCWHLLLLVHWAAASPIPDKPSAEASHRISEVRGRAVEEDGGSLELENGVDQSISNIAAQLLDEAPISSSETFLAETNTENQAKVVDHIKGLLSDIVTNTIVDSDVAPDTSGMYVVDMDRNTPTILQTVFNLDTNTIKDKESFIKVINEMKEREKQTTEIVDTTTYASVFETSKEIENEVKNVLKKAEKPSILDQYIEVYDDASGNNEGTSTSTEVILKSADTTTASTTSSTTTATTTTPTTTSSTTTSTSTTTQSTTTTTKAPTLLERAGQVVTGGLGGIFNGFASIGQAFTQIANPFNLQIPIGRKKRDIEDIADVVKSQISSKDIFMNFLLFQKRIKAMNPEKLNEIVKGVVRKVINTDAGDNGGETVGQYENLYDEIIAKQVTELLLKPRPYNKQRVSKTKSDIQQLRPKTTEINDPTETQYLATLKNTKSGNTTPTPATTTTTALTTTASTTATPTTTTPRPRPTSTPASLLVSLLRDQGPQTLGVSLASLAYTVVAAMPYWLPTVAG